MSAKDFVWGEVFVVAGLDAGEVVGVVADVVVGVDAGVVFDTLI